MSIFMSDDPNEDFNRLDAKQAEYLNRLPVCDCCHEPIQDEYLYDICGDFICGDCLNRLCRKHTEDFLWPQKA